MTILKKYAPWLIAVVAILSALWTWYHPEVRYEPDGTTINITDTVVSYQTVTVKEIKVIPGERVENKPVVATGEVKHSQQDHEIKAAIDTQTGKVDIYSVAKPRSFFSFEDDKEIGMIYGAGAAAYARWTFARVGSFYISADAVAATIQGSTGYAAGVGISYRW